MIRLNTHAIICFTPVDGLPVLPNAPILAKLIFSNEDVENLKFASAMLRRLKLDSTEGDGCHFHLSNEVFVDSQLDEVIDVRDGTTIRHLLMQASSYYGVTRAVNLPCYLADYKLTFIIKNDDTFVIRVRATDGKAQSTTSASIKLSDMSSDLFVGICD
ncbi:hypothetical protein [Photobacterium kishitanii]|uniref:Uncharacterized protein n=1 Tax=Photobacterium kishitanii TaxID=318456 RepID=A0A2T3KLT3_9GAMM|nr:hypothetical protein [Photobacterium kishitanii]PSV00662.1 hypothetical protein C9J27_05855 [Photobacterium kishitanii]